MEIVAGLIMFVGVLVFCGITYYYMKDDK